MGLKVPLSIKVNSNQWKRVRKIDEHITAKACYQGASRFHVQQTSQKNSEYDAHATKESRQHSNQGPSQTTTTRLRQWTKKRCSTTKNSVYFALKTKHSLRGWQCNKHHHHHSNNNNKVNERPKTTHPFTSWLANVYLDTITRLIVTTSIHINQSYLQKYSVNLVINRNCLFHLIYKGEGRGIGFIHSVFHSRSSG
jgi:hypothetical protein